MKKHVPGTVSDYRKRYNYDLMFFCELQGVAYGTVLEQAEFFQEKMQHYLNGDLIELKLNAIDNVLEEEKERNNRFQNLIARGGLIFTIIFALPAIQESLEIIRIALSVVKIEIYSLLLEPIGVLLWLILCLVVLFMFRKRRDISRD